MIAKFKFGEWLPDSGPYFQEQGGVVDLIRAENVLVKKSGYTIVPEMYSPPTEPTIATGLTYMTDSKANLWSFVQVGTTQNNWYYGTTTGSTLNSKTYDPTAKAFTALADRRRAGGYSASSASGWKFCCYGTKTLATNGTDAIQKRTPGSGGAFAKNNVIAAPVTADPRASFIESFKNHIVIGNFDLTAGTSGAETYGGAYGILTATTYPTGIWWSALDDETRFADPDTTPSVIGSDFKILFDDLGAITGLKACSDYMAIFREGGIMVMTGPPFQFTVLRTDIGTNFYNSITRVGNDVYFLTDEGPAVIKDGREVRMLGDDKIEDWIKYLRMPLWPTTDYNFYFHGASTHNGEYVVWSYPRLSGHLKTVPSAGGSYSEQNFNTMLCYNVDHDAFTYLNIKDPYSPEVNTVTPICSYGKRITPFDFDSADLGVDEILNNNLSGISVVLKGDSIYHPDMTIGNYDDNMGLFNGFRNNLESASDNLGKIATGYIATPTNPDELPSYRIIRARPIVWGEKGISPTETMISRELCRAIRIHPRNAYWGKDRTYDPTEGTAEDGFEAASGTYVSNTSLDATNGWFYFSTCPFASMHSLEFEFYATTATRLIYGFEMEIEFGGNPSSAKSLELRS